LRCATLLAHGLRFLNETIDTGDFCDARTV
jgi:hypothetical protein